jgi:hypothetical protein
MRFLRAGLVPSLPGGPGIVPAGTMTGARGTSLKRDRPVAAGSACMRRSREARPGLSRGVRSPRQAPWWRARKASALRSARCRIRRCGHGWMRLSALRLPSFSGDWLRGLTCWHSSGAAASRERISLTNAIMSKRKKRRRRPYQQASHAGRTGSAARSRVRCDPAIVRRSVAAMALLWARFLPAAQAMRRQGRVALFAARLAADAAGGADAGLSRGHRGRTAANASSVADRMGFAPLPVVEFCSLTGRLQKGPTFRFLSELICSLVTTKPSQIQRMAEARPNSPATRRA